MFRNHGQLAEDERERPLGDAEAKHGRGIVGHEHRIECREVTGACVSRAGIACREQGECYVARRRGLPVMPGQPGREMERELAMVGRPLPRARRVGRGRECAVITGERGEEGVPLHLSRERVDRHQRVARFEIRARGKYHGASIARRGSAARRHAAREHQPED
jgi:hypothetical protein